jgi:hypothetical protein
MFVMNVWKPSRVKSGIAFCTKALWTYEYLEPRAACITGWVLNTYIQTHAERCHLRQILPDINPNDKKYTSSLIESRRIEQEIDIYFTGLGNAPTGPKQA